MDQNNQKNPSYLLRVARAFFGFWDFFNSIGPMLIGLVVGAVLGGAAAIVLSFSIISGVLVGAVSGFLLAVLVQVLILGSGL